MGGADHGERGEVRRPEWSRLQPTHATLEQEARYLVSAAAAAGLAIRVIGGVAVFQVLDDESRRQYEEARECPHDIDLLARPKTSGDVKVLFSSLGYVPDERLIAWHGDRRHRYFHLDDDGRPLVEVDIFLGRPPLCHPIDFMQHLDRPGPAMGPTDLLLQKLQVHGFTVKDAVDAAFLLAEFPLSFDDDTQHAIFAPEIAGLLARNWGFHHTATTNLERVPGMVGGAVPEAISQEAAKRSRELREAIFAATKSRRWKLRAKVGTRVQWYEDVEEVLR